MRIRLHLINVATMLLLACVITAQLLVSMPGPGRSTLDFAALWASGYAYRQGLSPYTEPDRIVQVDYPLGSANANPPISLVLFVPLSHLPLDTAFPLMYYASLAVYALSTVLIARHAEPRPTPRCVAWALAMAAPWYTLRYGQIYILLLPLVMGAWWCLSSRRYVAAGVLLGALTAVKPNFALWPALLLLGGYWTAGLAAGAVAVGLTAAALLAFGPAAYRDWLALGGHFLQAQAAPLRDVLTQYPLDMSLHTLTARLGLPWLVYPLALGLLTSSAWMAWRLRPRAQMLSALALVLTLLISPRAWLGYAVLLLPLFLVRRWSWLQGGAAGLLLLPFWLAWVIPELMGVVSAVLGVMYPLALVLLLAHCFGAIGFPRVLPRAHTTRPIAGEH